MKSEIKIDFIDRGTGAGLEPVIRVEIRNTDDPRDKLISSLFQSIREQSYLQLYYSNHRHTTTTDNLPDMEKTVILFKPEADTDDLLRLLRTLFYEWADKNGWGTSHEEHLTGKQYYFKKGSKGEKALIPEDELFAQFQYEKIGGRT